MGSWAELDAHYPPGTLTPALAYVVALTHGAGVRSVYESDGRRATFLPEIGLGGVPYEILLRQAEEYLKNHSLQAFLAEAPPLLNREQKIAILGSVRDVARAQGRAASEEHSIYQQMLAAFGMQPDQVSSALQDMPITPDEVLFPQ